jgi:hypothetical protein
MAKVKIVTSHQVQPESTYRASFPQAVMGSTRGLFPATVNQHPPVHHPLDVSIIITQLWMNLNPV